MHPLIIVAIVLVVLLLAALLIWGLTKKSGNNSSDPAHTGHAEGEEDANCLACQASAKVKKVKIPLACAVHFRPKTGWTGEFGFDWLRINDVSDGNYKDIILGAYKSTNASGVVQVHNAADAYKLLKKEYPELPTVIKAKPEDIKEFFSSYLNLYPKDVTLNPAAPFEAELKVLIAVEKSEPDKIEIDYDKTFFTLDKETLADKAVGAKREASDKTVKITCIKQFDTEQKITVLAYPKGWKTKNDATVVGQLIVGTNNAAARKELKMVFVKVKTRVTNVPRVGSLQADEKDKIVRSLHQALIHSVIENGPDLDLTKDKEFRITKDSKGKKKYGKYIYKSTGVADTNIDGGLFEDYQDAAGKLEMFSYVRQKFLVPAKNQKYSAYFTIFIFDEPTYDPVTYGQVETLGVRNVALFKAVRPKGVLSHEILHGLGLHHTHGKSPVADAKFYYTQNKTDNVMSYNFPAMNTTWAWQWKIIRSKV